MPDDSFAERIASAGRRDTRWYHNQPDRRLRGMRMFALVMLHQDQA